jgi:hypothetical protein
MDKRLQYILILAFVLNAALVFSNFQNRTYDSFEHIFFAGHYQKSWFNVWDLKWYGGFTVTSYPPLAHQCVALLGFLTGLEWAYKILTLTLMTLLPFAVYLFSKIFLNEKAAIYSAAVSVFLPSILQASYSFGQLPTIFGLVTALFCIVYLNKFLENNSLASLLISLGFLGVSVSSHHFTAVFFVPILILILAIHFLMAHREVPGKTLLKRLSLFGVIGVVLCIIVIFPYWMFTLTNPPNAPIPHLSRTDIFSQTESFELFFWNIYGPLIFLLPFMGFLCLKRKALLPLFVGVVFMLILGLGGTTPIPGLLFGKSWEVLTYDRFALWASIMLLPLTGLFFRQYYNAFNRRVGKIVAAGFFLALIFTSIFGASAAFYSPSASTIANVDPFIEFLNANQTQSWRYLTLGLGEPAMLKINVYASAKSIDGYYFFVRTDPLLAQSGIGQLDAAKYYGEKGISILNQVLANSTEYSLRWVICADPTYYTILTNNSFVERWTQDSTGDSRFGGITIWEYNGTVPEYVLNIPPANSLLVDNLIWGIAPPLTLIVTFLGITYQTIKDRRVKIAEKLESMGNKKQEVH